MDWGGLEPPTGYKHSLFKHFYSIIRKKINTGDYRSLPSHYWNPDWTGGCTAALFCFPYTYMPSWIESVLCYGPYEPDLGYVDLLNHWDIEKQRDRETELDLWEKHRLVSYQQPAYEWKDHISQPPQNLAFKRKRSSAHTFLSEIGPEKTPSLLRHFIRRFSQGLSGHRDLEERLLSSISSVNHSICSWHFHIG